MYDKEELLDFTNRYFSKMDQGEIEAISSFSSTGTVKFTLKVDGITFHANSMTDLSRERYILTWWLESGDLMGTSFIIYEDELSKDIQDSLSFLRINAFI